MYVCVRQRRLDFFVIIFIELRFDLAIDLDYVSFFTLLYFTTTTAASILASAFVVLISF